MNERIKELAEQAGITTNLDTDYYEKDMNKWVDYFSEKFAELLITEAIDVVENTGRQCALTTYDLNVVDCTIAKSANALSAHFDIKQTFGIRK